MEEKGSKPGKRASGLKSAGNDKIHILFLAIPVVGITVFTVLPLLFMILTAFTDYDASHLPGFHFKGVGLQNFAALFSGSGGAFGHVLGWTFIWGICATLTCYFGGLLLAMMINSKGLSFRKFWKTVFIITCFIPAFISVGFVSTMLTEGGIFNVLLKQWGFTDTALPFLTDANLARVTAIVVNLWTGVPMAMLIISGVMMRIPEEVYDSAKLDGAGSLTVFAKVTFPYVWSATIPYLLLSFAGNLNNFNAIYFLTKGGPELAGGAGSTDLLVTWFYKLTKENGAYNIASAIGILIFIITAALGLITFMRSDNAEDKEGLR